ncbi:MAG: lipoate--protein ligase family protein [Chloroflexota bacterium]|nr:lipoate--protein ligase family protein [Chloroflexota bacterium]MDE2951457.1 lipoate--protein ligase family protein [Chloroflexota bacterium]
MPQLRLIRDSTFQNGSRNMATDCAIFEAVSAGRQPPTMRLYGWEPMCLSLGYGQRSRDVDMGRLRARGWQLVRRPTGGKAILHGDELTYSLCLPINHPLAAGDVVDSYRRIGAGLASGLEGLGATIISERKDPRDNKGAGPVCFEIASHYEITVAGRKLVGSAQMRRKAGLLQHGTIPVRGDVGRICDVLSFEREEEREAQRQSVRLRAVTLESTMESPPSWDDVADAIVRGVERTYGYEILCQELSQDEIARIETLMAERFANPHWTAKR